MRKTLLALLLVAANLSAAVYQTPSKAFKSRRDIAAIFLEHNGYVLMLHRQEGKTHEHKWAIPGGKVDLGETPLQGVLRELQEETGYLLSPQEVDPIATVYVEHNVKDHFVYHMFRAKLAVDPGAVKINFQEHQGFTWVTPEEALHMDLMDDEDPCFRLVYGL